MTTPRLPPNGAAAADPLARVGRQLIAAERRLRWRRTRRRIAGGSLGGVALLAVLAVVALPGAGGERVMPGTTVHAASPVGHQAARSGRVSLYDWEASVVSPDGRAVAEEERSGTPSTISQAAGAARHGLTLHDANALAARVGHGARVVAALRPQAKRAPGDHHHPAARFYVLRGEPALTGADIAGAQATTSPWGQPSVLFTLTPEGQSAFHALTRAVSQRGQSLMRPGAPAGAAAQHYAMVLDHRLISVPLIDPQQLPDGIDGTRGATLEGGYTRADAQRLARALAP
ncbi:MAG TPA: hypothetical protein VGM91_16905 [Conexibacter sp.]